MKKFDPYSKNIIFVDTEFSTGKPNKGELLSIGMVKLNGEELYVELKYEGKLDPWVIDNVVPFLTEKKISKANAIRKIKKFVGKDRPYAVLYIYLSDITYLHNLFDSKSIDGLPFNWIPIDFATILFSLGFDPNSYHPRHNENLLKKIGIDVGKYNIHNALDDAKLLREVYMKMMKK